MVAQLSESIKIKSFAHFLAQYCKLGFTIYEDTIIYASSGKFY